MEKKSLWHLYGIIYRADAGLIEPSAGIDGSPIRIVAGGNLAAVAAHLRRNGVAAARDSADHDRVVQDIFSRVPIMPLPFGAQFTNREAIERLLVREGPLLRSRFDDIRDTAQWQVRLHADPNLSDMDVDGTAEKVYARLAAHAIDDESDMFLVRRDAEYSFVEAADAMSEHCRKAGLRLEVHGPHPAYHFADLPIGIKL